MDCTAILAASDPGVEAALGRLSCALFDVAGPNVIAGNGSVAYTLLFVIAYITGIIIMFQSVLRLSRAVQFSGGFSPTQSLYTGPIVGFLIAGLLIAFPQTFITMNETVFGMDNEIMSYKGMAAGATVGPFAVDSYDLALGAIVLFIQFVGWLAIFRGLLVIKRASEGSGQSSYSTGIWHMVGGTLSANVIAFASVLQNTLCGVGNPNCFFITV